MVKGNKGCVWNRKSKVDNKGIVANNSLNNYFQKVEYWRKKTICSRIKTALSKLI